MFSRPSSLLRSKLGRLGCMAAAVAALAGCGGSSVDPFEPQRILSLGDEYSVIESGTGLKYTVNALNNCDANRIWNQQLVESFGFSFKECNPNNRDPGRALLYAAAGARVETGDNSIAAQIERHRTSGGGFRNTDLVVMMAGANDVLALADAASPLTEAQRVEEATRLGRVLAEQANALANAGTPVVVVSAPNQGETPYARQSGNAALLARLSTAFNDSLRFRLIDDGRKLGFANGEGEIHGLQFPRNGDPIYSVTQRTDPACASATGTACNTGNAAGNYGNYLYATDRFLSTTANTRLFAIAERVAKDNPF